MLTRKPGQTKGGYLEGVIKIPRVKGKLRMEIQTYPAEDVDPIIKNLHPALLHVVRIGKGKRYQSLEPVPRHYHWKQVFEIENGKVKILNRLSDLDIGNDCVPQVDEITEVHGDSIILGGKNGMLNLIFLLPKQKQTKKGDATFAKVLEDRLPLVSRETITLFEKKFIKNPKNLKRIRLKVDFYTEYGQHCGSAFSSVITDTKDKDVGSIDFYDANPLKSCANGGRKINMISEYELAHDVAPIFQIYDENGYHRPDMERFLIQPEKVKIKNRTIIFITPQQTKLQHIHEYINNFEIKLVGKRKWDGLTSIRKFKFGFEEHVADNCPFCNHKVDSDDPVQIEAEIKPAKPGRIKRHMMYENQSMPSVSTSSSVSEGCDKSNKENDEDISFQRINFSEINVKSYNFDSEDDFNELLTEDSGLFSEEEHVRDGLVVLNKIDDPIELPRTVKCLKTSQTDQEDDKQSMSSLTTSSGIKESKKENYKDMMELTNMDYIRDGNTISLENVIKLLVEDNTDDQDNDITDGYDLTKSDSYCQGVKSTLHCYTIPNGLMSAKDAMMSHGNGSNLSEDNVENPERNVIFMDGKLRLTARLTLYFHYLLGSNIAKDEEAVSNLTIQKEEMILKTKTRRDSWETKNENAEALWPGLTAFIENSLLEKVPFMSFSFMIILILFNAVAEFTAEVSNSLFFLVFVFVVSNLLMTFLYKKNTATKFKIGTCKIQR